MLGDGERLGRDDRSVLSRGADGVGDVGVTGDFFRVCPHVKDQLVPGCGAGCGRCGEQESLGKMAWSKPHFTKGVTGEGFVGLGADGREQVVGGSVLNGGPVAPVLAVDIAHRLLFAEAVCAGRQVVEAEFPVGVREHGTGDLLPLVGSACQRSRQGDADEGKRRFARIELAVVVAVDEGTAGEGDVAHGDRGGLRGRAEGCVVSVGRRVGRFAVRTAGLIPRPEGDSRIDLTVEACIGHKANASGRIAG